LDTTQSLYLYLASLPCQLGFVIPSIRVYGLFWRRSFRACKNGGEDEQRKKRGGCRQRIYHQSPQAPSWMVYRLLNALNFFWRTFVSSFTPCLPLKLLGSVTHLEPYKFRTFHLIYEVGLRLRLNFQLQENDSVLGLVWISESA
jgi:hypothetical protein